MFPEELITAVKNGNISIISQFHIDNNNLFHIHDADNFNMSLLHIAVAASNLDSINFLLNNTDIDINATQKIGRTALHMAAIKGKLPVIDLLLKNGINVHLLDNSKQKALDMAKTSQAVELLASATLNHENYFYHQLKSLNYTYLNRKFQESEQYKFDKLPDGNSLLHYAVSIKNHQLLQYLINCGCDITAFNRDGISPIHLAFINNDELSINILLNDSTINLKDSQGLVPLHYFLAANDPNDFVEPNPPFFINNSINEKENSMHHQPSFSFSFSFNFDDVAEKPVKKIRQKKEKSNEVYNILLHNGADITAVARGGVTSLHLAADSGNCMIIEDLIKRGVNINAQTKTTGATPLHIAYYNQNHNAVSLLIENCANIDITDYYGRRYNEL